eukprot:GILI01023704.1.p1 GENE.GILI01023704.1~~GILI01023704.1.p1  ORF type:complete len:726 (-),score=68.94 GILI01023704.1:67-2244(-)
MDHDPSALVARLKPTILPSIRDTSSVAQDAHRLLHLSSHPWQNKKQRKLTASQLLSFIVGCRERYPVTSFVSAVVILQRIWRGVICRRRILRAFRAKRLVESEFESSRKYDKEALAESQSMTAAEASNYESATRHLIRRAIPWPALSERAAAYERCLRISEVMQASEEASKAGQHNEQDDLIRAMEVESAAKALQQRVRALLMHREVHIWWLRERWPIFFVSAVTIQRAWMTFCVRRKSKSTVEKNEKESIGSPYLLNKEAVQLRRKVHRRFFLTKADAAAAKVQDWWRRCLQRKIFRYFIRVIRDSAAIVSTNNAKNDSYGRSKVLRPFLGNHSNSGPEFGSSPSSPSSKVSPYQRTAHALLKQIDFGEACMLQAAGSGLHVRFRLAHGGVVPFPPVIVYKVSTHAHVVDMGLFAPKNYVLEGRIAQERRSQPIIVHNKVDSISQSRRSKLSATLTGSLQSPTGVQFVPRSPILPSPINTAHQNRVIIDQSGRKGPAPTPLTWVSNDAKQARGPLTPTLSLMSSEDSNGRYERKDNNPWRLADTSAITDDSHLGQLLSSYELSAKRSLQATKAAKQFSEMSAHSTHVRRTEGVDASALIAKQLVSAARSQAATGNRKRGAVEDAVVATQRRWLAELYASEKVFEHLKTSSGAAADKGPFSVGTSLGKMSKGGSYYFDTKTNAELLFRKVPLADLRDEVDKVRQWHEALDFSSYRAAWLVLGTST